MKKYFNLLAVLMMLPATAAFGASQQEPALGSPGGPVSPLCFSNLQEGAVIDPQNCIPDYLAPESSGSFTPEAGFYGMAYSYKDESGSIGQAFIEYRHLGETKGREAVLVRENSGGSGVFSTLYLLSRTNDGKLKVDSIVAAGDRCSNGIKDAYVDGAGALHYDQNLTQQGLYQLSGAAADAAKAGLEDCAECCVGTARFTDGKLERVVIADQNIQPAPTGGLSPAPKQCFNSLLLSAPRQDGHPVLRPGNLRPLAANFRQTCAP